MIGSYLFKWKGVTVHDWPNERQAGMHATVQTLLPDILCTQETAPEYLDTILDCHDAYKCVLPDDTTVKENLSQTDPVRKEPFLAKHLRTRRGNLGSENDSEGWLEEGNIVWRSDKFDFVSHGTVDVGIQDAESRKPKRGLFFVRLRPRIPHAKSILVSTAHLTWEGGSGTEQIPPYTSERCAQARRIIDAIKTVRQQDEPVILCGDMNDSWHVPFMMRDNGLHAFDFLLKTPTEMTHPARPCYHEERIPSQTRDWIFSDRLKPIMGRVCGNMTLGLNRHPSDHFPVLCVYEVPS